MCKENYIGIMSGTSLDGVDVVLCEIDKNVCNLRYSLEYTLPKALKLDILASIEDKSTLVQIAELDHRLGVLFAEAVNHLLKENDIDYSRIIAIGSHGQTLWHAPNGIYPFSMQLGDPNIITATTGIPVVADFRRKDMALGGQGAPFAPAFHAFMFSSIHPSIAVVNIGGMANITVLNEQIIGYDTGCGNVLLDSWINKHQGVPYDKEGEWAYVGKLHKKLLEKMLSDDYFSLPYPKSTGREKFNLPWLEDILEPYTSVTPVDIQRTLLEFTAKSISNEVLKFDRQKVFLCGGGAKNTFLIERIQTLLPQVEVKISPHADQIEAMTFAWLAYKRIHKEKVNLKDVTGARENTILGAIYA